MIPCFTGPRRHIDRLGLSLPKGGIMNSHGSEQTAGGVSSSQWPHRHLDSPCQTVREQSGGRELQIAPRQLAGINAETPWAPRVALPRELCWSPPPKGHKVARLCFNQGGREGGRNKMETCIHLFPYTQTTRIWGQRSDR